MPKLGNTSVGTFGDVGMNRNCEKLAIGFQSQNCRCLRARSNCWEFHGYESDFEIQTDVRIGQTDLSADVELAFDDEENLVAVD